MQTVTAAGERNFGTIIPANSALVFDVELMDLKPNPGSRDEL
jgi:FKBP-type peptidyl-prolyl cis-trans isomerase